MEVYLHAFLISAPDGGEWSASRPSQRTTGTHSIGAWVRPRTCLDAVAKRKFSLPVGEHFPYTHFNIVLTSTPRRFQTRISSILAVCAGSLQRWKGNSLNSITSVLVAYLISVFFVPGKILLAVHFIWDGRLRIVQDNVRASHTITAILFLHIRGGQLFLLVGRMVLLRSDRGPESHKRLST
jgi:hypothetical protein